MTIIKSILFFPSLLFGVIQLNAQTHQSTFSIKDFRGCWQLKDMVYESNGGRYGPKDVDKLVGAIVCFNKEPIDILGDTIFQAQFSLEKESTKNYIVRNFEVFQHIEKWFKITADSLYVIKLISGTNITPDSTGRIRQSEAYNFEFAYDGNYLYLPLNGGFFRFTKCALKNPDDNHKKSSKSIKAFQEIQEA